MILKPFKVQVGPKRYDFIDHRSIDSKADREDIRSQIIRELFAQQQDAMCSAIGVPEHGAFKNIVCGVYDGSLVGVYFISTIDYVSGPWEDLVLWEEISNDPIVVHGRPMPGFSGLAEQDETDLAVEAGVHLLRNKIDTVGGHRVEFKLLSWAIFEGRTDAGSQRAKRIHGATRSDNRIKMTELPDVSNALLTRVDIEKK